MKGSKDESGLERSSTSRHLKAGGHFATSRRGFGLIAGSSSKDIEDAWKDEMEQHGGVENAKAQGSW
ncbi:hypothetical protein MA16_Dca018406 [Dendrobium catenatum]|uniref:Uncharacterized protein n=1 Tax=Dendrobium catenatum TaxID=906689 RepID=A0A2I0WHJ7_9ASPA|nr:hypothetical protein MA16_Dca018406 [Dendrobium catenatum]